MQCLYLYSNIFQQIYLLFVNWISLHSVGRLFKLLMQIHIVRPRQMWICPARHREIWSKFRGKTHKISIWAIWSDEQWTKSFYIAKLKYIPTHLSCALQKWHHVATIRHIVLWESIHGSYSYKYWRKVSAGSTKIVMSLLYRVIVVFSIKFTVKSFIICSAEELFLFRYFYFTQ